MAPFVPAPTRTPPNWDHRPQATEAEKKMCILTFLTVFTALTCSFAMLFGIFGDDTKEGRFNAVAFIALLGYFWCFCMCTTICREVRAVDLPFPDAQA